MSKDICITRYNDTQATVLMASDKAKKAVRKSTLKNDRPLHDLTTMDNTELAKILAWAVSWKLTIESDVPIIIQPRIS